MAIDSSASPSGGDQAPDNPPAANAPLLRPEDVDALVGQPATAPAAPRHATRLSSHEVEQLLARAEQALQSLDRSVADIHPVIKAYQLPEIGDPNDAEAVGSLEMLGDVELDLKIELGRTHMYLEDVMQLRKGSVVPLDKLAGDPVDILVNGRLVGRGEVVVLDDKFCVRVVELISGTSSAAG